MSVQRVMRKIFNFAKRKYPAGKIVSCEMPKFEVQYKDLQKNSGLRWTRAIEMIHKNFE